MDSSNSSFSSSSLKRSLLGKRRKDILRESILKVTDDHQVNWADVKKKVAEGDLSYSLALSIAQSKIDAYEDTNITERALKYVPIYKATRPLAYFLLTVYMLLSLVQKPTWCMQPTIAQPDSNAYYDDCTGTTLEGKVIPVSNLPYLPNWVLLAIELFSVTFLVLRKYAQKVLEQRKKRSFMPILTITILVWVADFVQYGFNLRYPLNQFLRPVYLIIYMGSIRRTIVRYVQILWRSKEIFITIAGTFMFFACLARIIFYRTAQNATNPEEFDTLPDTLYNLFVAMTTSNYPDVMMPIYREYRLASLYFIIFMAVVSVVLLRVILAYFYFHYKKDISSEAKLFQRKRTYHEIIDEPDHDDVSPDTNDSPDSSSPTLPPHTSLGSDNNGYDSDHILEEMDNLQKEDMDRLFRDSKFKRVLFETLNTFNTKTIFAMCSLLVFVLVIVESNEVSPDPQTDFTAAQVNYDKVFDNYWAWAEFALNWFLILDPFLRVISLGWRCFLRSKFLLFDFCLTIAILFTLSLRLFVSPTFPLFMIKIMIIFRLWRFLRWVQLFEKYKLLFETLFKLVPLFLDLLGVVGLAFYIYTTFGTTMFGGQLRTNININFSEAGDPQYYIYVNFNDFYMGFFTCFHLLIVNNWLYTVDVHCKIMGSYVYRIFFVSFYIITVMVCLNIMISFILEMFMAQISKHDLEFHREDSIQGMLAEEQKLIHEKIERKKSRKDSAPPEGENDLKKRLIDH